MIVLWGSKFFFFHLQGNLIGPFLKISFTKINFRFKLLKKQTKISSLELFQPFNVTLRSLSFGEIIHFGRREKKRPADTCPWFWMNLRRSLETLSVRNLRWCVSSTPLFLKKEKCPQNWVSVNFTFYTELGGIHGMWVGSRSKGAQASNSHWIT